ncbi:MAG: GFA family protein [Candidatus Binataceae bacterium]
MDLNGGCACGAIRYTLTASPLIVHACHCRDCQRVTGSAFVINIWIERKFVRTLRGVPKSFRLAGGTGQGHDVYFCGKCGTYVWSRYHGAPGDALFVRAGTLDKPQSVKPDIHIFTRSKLPWMVLPKGAIAAKTFYNIPKVWSAKSKERLRSNVAEKS